MKIFIAFCLSGVIIPPNSVAWGSALAVWLGVRGAESLRHVRLKPPTGATRVMMPDRDCSILGLSVRIIVFELFLSMWAYVRICEMAAIFVVRYYT